MAEYDKNLEYISQTQTLVGRKSETGRYPDRRGYLGRPDYEATYGTKNFWKCYLMDFLTVLGIIDSKQLDVFIYIVENTSQGNNMFIGTYSKIAKDVACAARPLQPS